jgi:drug/metabolite transporter (DMT)-like permease
MRQSENQDIKSGKLSAYLAAVVVVCIWSGWITLSRMGVHTNLTPYDITLLRFGTAAILTLPFSLRYDWKNVKWHQILLVALGCGFPYTMFSFFGLKTIKAANAGVLVNGMLPVIGLFFTLFWFKEKVNRMKYLAIVILLAANVMIANLSVSIAAEFLPGILCLLSAAVVFSTYMAATRRWGYKMNDVIAFVPAVNAVLFLPLWFLSPTAIWTSPFQDVAIQMIYQGIVVSVFALLLITYTVNKLGSGTMSVFLSYVPVVTAVLAFLFLNESLTLTEQSGIVLCSVGLMIYAKS